MQFFKCIPADHHATVAVNHSNGEPYAVYEGLIGCLYGQMVLGHENNGWFAGFAKSHVMLSNCLDTTWIIASQIISHVWHVDRAGTTIVVESCGGMHLIFGDGVMADFEHADFDKPHGWGRTNVYFDSKGFMLYYVWDNPDNRLIILNINELHLLATILAKSCQYG